MSELDLDLPVLPGRIGIAAFDVDGTLTNRDCVVPFLRRFGRRPVVLLRSLTQARNGVVGVASRDRDRLRAAATRAVLAGVPYERVEREAERFASEVFARRMRRDTTARLRWHIDQGHRVVLVSASYEPYLLRLADALGAHAVLATRLQVDADGRCTGQLDGPNCRAGEKVRRLLNWFAEEGLDRRQVELWAYGDASGDRELLALADHPVWVKERLASVAPTVVRPPKAPPP